ncbi:hypothetical protein FEM48_Zijuj09G0230100 [Ziziphus jujuba var. spinosa]|uniref:OTU domain-containing protein n=1 Tax=Ziziphus jujuba var. spinosa TaxID=714518 RepID=A0A978UVU0_ZIZJJ|nr:hypothetical protein FEM48_Zijuj09G0230100 [Ziziphus jujuba var. spinosa]
MMNGGNQSQCSSSTSFSSSSQQDTDMEDDRMIALILTEEYANLDGAVARRLSDLAPVPHIPRINSFIPNLSDASLDHQRLIQRLNLYGLREVKVSGDGNCQFRALSDQMYKSPEYHKHVRKEIVKQVEHLSSDNMDGNQTCGFGYPWVLPHVGQVWDERNGYGMGWAYPPIINMGLGSGQRKGVFFDLYVYLKDSRSLYEGYVPMKYKRYYKRMAKYVGEKSGEWGDHVTLQAAADKFAAKICLLTSFRDTCFIEIMPQYQAPRCELWLSFWSEVHYNSLYEIQVAPIQPKPRKKHWLF